MHEQGYSFFDAGRLTLAEIGLLVEEKNRQVREQERLSRLARMKRRR